MRRGEGSVHRLQHGMCRSCELRGHLKAGIGKKSILHTQKRFNCHIYVDDLGQSSEVSLVVGSDSCEFL